MRQGSRHQDLNQPQGESSPPSAPPQALPSRLQPCAPLPAPLSGTEDTCVSFPTHPPPPFTQRFHPSLGELWGGSWRRGSGGGGCGGAEAGWVGKAQGGCGLAASLQLVAGPRSLPLARVMEGKVFAQTHQRAQLGHVSGRQLAAQARRGALEAVVTASTASNRAPSQLGTSGFWPPPTKGRFPAARTVALWGRTWRKPASGGAVTADVGGSPRSARSPGAALVPARVQEDARLLLLLLLLLQSRCGLGCCADPGSGRCPCCARAAGARPAAPGSSLLGKCGKRALNSTTWRQPPPPGSFPAPDSQPRAPPACAARPPASSSRTQLAPIQHHQLSFWPTRAPAPRSSRTGPIAAGTAGASRWPAPAVPAPKTPTRSLLVARDDGEHLALLERGFQNLGWRLQIWRGE